MTEPSPDAIAAIRQARAEEKQQTLFYRLLAAEAEAAGRPEDAERLNGMLADEQHHLSRLSARLLELGHEVEDLRALRAPDAVLEGWQAVARGRERAEVERYEALSDQRLDEATRRLVADILESERQHEQSLGGKWMRA